MNEQEIRNRFSNLNVWTIGDQRAPNKPLLVLYALGKLWQGNSRIIHFSDVNKDVGQLLINFGPPVKAIHPEYPFWYLKNDGIWEVEDVSHLTQLKGKSHETSKKILLQYDASGGFTPDVFKFLRTHPSMIQEIAGVLLQSHFSESLHNDILKSVGLEFDAASSRTAKRDPDFRNRVLSAYEYRCAICEFDIRLETKIIGIEAAHIKWYQAGRPDTVNNGLALCTFHYKTFALGALGISDKHKIEISEKAHGTHGFEELLMRFNGCELRLPVNREYTSSLEYIKWHKREVFRKPARPIQAK